MNPLRTVCLLMGILALASANNPKGPMRWSANSIKNSLKPTDWLSVSQLESLPSMNSVNLKSLEQMPLQEGADLINKMYHLSQAGEVFQPKFAPKPRDINCYLITPENQKLNFKLNELPRIAEQQNNFGNQEVTIFIAGLPQQTETVKKATRKLVQAYMQRYNGPAPEPLNVKYESASNEQINVGSSEEEWKNGSKKPSGNLVVIEFGNVLSTANEYTGLDVEQAGIEIGNVLVQLTDKANVPQEIIHVIGSHVGAHVAGAAGRQFTRQTGHQLRRITGLDPSKIYAHQSGAVTGLARGDAEFVDAIHTSAYGMGTTVRCGDADFYPNGPNEGVPGADNVVEANVRAIRYFAESVVPGNERNFPAVGATSWEEFKQQNGYGKRVYMGINTDYDVEGDFILQVNAKSPFGRSAPVQKQQNRRNIHKPWKMSA
uniref:Yolk protein C n=1 Tax=Sarcophaga bullata TaxID=7385 RepID=Q6RSI7_SARBU|nr:yolk protein C [Sarcophaga bullata]